MKRSVFPLQEGVAVTNHHLHTAVVPVHASSGGSSQKYDKANAEATFTGTAGEATVGDIEVKSTNVTVE